MAPVLALQCRELQLQDKVLPENNKSEQVIRQATSTWESTRFGGVCLAIRIEVSA